MQLVLSNNRILAHGENFLAMGGVVINTETGAKYENATIAECENCPSDINEVGYEYHAGQFVPCAPYGKGFGNLAVLCNNDCKAIKDSEVPLNKVIQFEEMPYIGTGTTPTDRMRCSVTFNITPVIVFVAEVKTSSNVCIGYMDGHIGECRKSDLNGSTGLRFWSEVNGNAIEWWQGADGGYADTYFNTNNAEYRFIALGYKGE